MTIKDYELLIDSFGPKLYFSGPYATPQSAANGAQPLWRSAETALIYYRTYNRAIQGRNSLNYDVCVFTRNHKVSLGWTSKTKGWWMF